jgi:hypothetical protein
MRPNFLIFITDQHRADHLGCYGNPIVRTPNIDALASAACRFDRAYVATSGVHAEPRFDHDRAHAVGPRRAQQRHSAAARVGDLSPICWASSATARR